MDVTIRPLAAERWPEAAAVAGRAFWTEAYMRPLDEDPVGRFATVQDIYRGMDVTGAATTTLAAFAGDHVVGIACVEAAGACFFCTMDVAADPKGDTELARRSHALDLLIRTLHVGLPLHAYIGPVAVEPTLQGHGIGSMLVHAAWALAAADGPATVALDCDPRLEPYYASRGFRRVGVVTDGWGFDIVGLRRDRGEAGI